MEKQKQILKIVYLGYFIFLVGTFIPSCPIKDKVVLEGIIKWANENRSLFNTHMFTAIAFVVIAYGLAKLSYMWKMYRGLGIASVVSSCAWLLREVFNTASQECRMYPTIGIIAMFLVILYFKSHSSK